MLTHRTNVLLTQEENQLLSWLATKEGVTKNTLIRHALHKVYSAKKPAVSLKSTLKSGWRLLQNPHQPLDYKQLVEYGRRS